MQDIRSLLSKTRRKKIQTGFEISRLLFRGLPFSFALLCASRILKPRFVRKSSAFHCMISQSQEAMIVRL